MIDLYFAPTPNGHKITLFLEEAELDYRLIKVDLGKGGQFRPEFLRISPNNKIPAIVDHSPADGGEPLRQYPQCCSSRLPARASFPAACSVHGKDAEFQPDNVQ